MYKDDQDALYARVQALEADLEAEKVARLAAELAAKAARAREDEARIALSRSRSTGRPSGRLIFVSIGFSVTIAMLLVLLFVSRERMALEQSERDARHLELERTCATLSKKLEETRRSAARNEEPPADPGRHPGITKEALRRSMKRIRGPVTACFARYRVPGLVEVKLTLERDGRIGAASIQGTFEGSPTAACVLEAVKKVRFPSFDGDHFTFVYPYLLR
jgi:hypothetical protein